MSSLISTGRETVFHQPADRDLHRVVLGLDIETTFLQELDNLIPGMESFHALAACCQFCKLANSSFPYLEQFASIGVESSIVVQDVDKLEIVSLTSFVIVGVVCRGDLDSTSTEFHVDDDGVCDDRDASIDKRMDNVFSMEML